MCRNVDRDPRFVHHLEPISLYDKRCRGLGVWYVASALADPQIGLEETDLGECAIYFRLSRRD